jgi:hypothetical protein
MKKKQKNKFQEQNNIFLRFKKLEYIYRFVIKMNNFWRFERGKFQVILIKPLLVFALLAHRIEIKFKLK